MSKVPSNRSGIHLLRSTHIAGAVVRSAGLCPDSLVVEFGAGRGALTAPLVRTGARVIAVERESRFVAALCTRFADCDRLSVIHADLRHVRLPREPFQVVASIPFAVATPLLRRLLEPARSRCSRADLIVEWGHAKRLVSPRPRDAATAWWAVRYRFELCARLPARQFRPAPAVDAAHLIIRRRPGLTPDRLAELHRLLPAVYGPDRAARKLLPANALRAANIPLNTRTGALTADQIYRALSS